MAPTQNHFEAYITVQMLLEALKWAGSREKLVKAPDGMKEVDVGGFEVDFSPTRHTASTSASSVIIAGWYSEQRCGIIAVDCCKPNRVRETFRRHGSGRLVGLDMESRIAWRSRPAKAIILT